MSVKVVNSGPGVINVSAETTPAIQVTSPTVSPVRIEFLSSSAALLPSGGIEGAILRKDSAASYDTDWTPYSFPAADGDDNQVLVTDGAGALTFDHVRSIRITIRNDEGATIPAGTPVYSKGEVGGSERILVGIADASDPAKMPAIGIAETTLTTTEDTKDGYAIMSGVFNTNVSGFTGLSEGDILYVSNSGGGLSQTKPTGTYLIQNVGIVLKTNGTILQGFQVSCIGRTNDVPNIPTGNIWAGNADGVATATSVAYIDIANERVGIGTSSPAYPLDVNGNIRATAYRIGGATILSGSTSVVLGSSGATGTVSINTIGGTALTVDSSANVGIGTTSPTAKLHSMAADGNAFSLRLGRADTGSTWSFNHAGDDLRIYNTGGSGKDILFGVNSGGVDQSNKVGIGTASPDERLHVNGSILVSANDIAYAAGYFTKIKSNYSDNPFVLESRAGTLMSARDYGRSLTFYAGPDGSTAEVMRVDESGYVGIGTTTPNYLLDVEGSGAGARVYNTSGVTNLYLTTTAGNNAILNFGPNTDLNEGNIVYRTASSSMAFTTNTSEAMRIDSSGNVGIGTTSPSAKLDVVGLANIKDVSNNVLITTNNAALTTGSSNAAVGYNALKSVTSASYNSAFGYSALESNLIGSSNSAFGTEALRYNTGANNTAFGTASLRNKTSGDNNSAFGVNALYNNLTGSSNIAIGRNAGYYTTGDNNALMGYYAGYGDATSTFSNTVAVGYQALYDLTTGINNTAVGYQAALNNSTGQYNTAGGYHSMRNATSSVQFNTALGSNSARNVTGNANTAVGHEASFNGGAGNSSFGWRAGYYAANYNVSVGYGAASNTTGTGNTVVGYNAAVGDATSDFSSTVAIGREALNSLTTGATNTAVGYQAGYSNSTGSGNIFIGYQAGYNETGSDKLYINNSSGSNPLIYGDFNLRTATINGDLTVSSGDFRADSIEINGRSQTSPAAGEYGAGSKIVTQFATGTVTAGVVYVASSGAWVQGDADVGSASIGMIAVATSEASATKMLIEGVIKLSSNAGFSGASAGDILYLSNTAGELTTTAPSGTGDYVRVCGYVVNASQNEVFFSPSKEWRVV